MVEGVGGGGRRTKLLMVATRERLFCPDPFSFFCKIFAVVVLLMLVLMLVLLLPLFLAGRKQSS